MEEIRGDYLADDRMAGRWTGDGFDFPPTLYPGRELFTFSLFVLALLTFVVAHVHPSRRRPPQPGPGTLLTLLRPAVSRRTASPTPRPRLCG
jgi:hypothetical protein